MFQFYGQYCTRSQRGEGKAGGFFFVFFVMVIQLKKKGEKPVHLQRKKRILRLGRERIANNS